jgi:phage terminase large subunit GpA-like protein
MTMVAALHSNNPLREEFAWLVEHARMPQRRTFREFLVSDFVIPKGEHKNTKIQLDVQPYTNLLSMDIDNSRWSKYAITGCVQSGKTTIAFTAVIMYFLFEYNEPVIVGVPTMKLGEKKWLKEILPAIMASRYRVFLPTFGRGSKSGFSEEIHFTNGSILTFMSGAGGDENRSSETARIVVITEADKIDTAGESSREADPIRQMAARAKSFKEEQRRLFLECTVSIEKGRIWTTFQSGTASRIACPCPYCEEYVTIERPHLMGWQQAESAREAHKLAHYACPNCGDPLTEADRIEMNLNAKLVHRGQSIDRFGNITGDLPDTDTYGFRWNCFNNTFMSAGEVGELEWNVVHGSDGDSAERELCQFYWVTPYKPPDFDNSPLDAEVVRRRFADRRYTKGLIPEEALKVTMAVDLGKRYFHWMLCAWMQGFRGIICDYGTFEVPWKVTNVEGEQKIKAEKKAILAALGSFRDDMVLGKEWLTPSGIVRNPQRILVDCAWYPDPVYEFIHEKETDRRFLPAIGYGQSQERYKHYREPKKTDAEVKLIGDQYHVVFVPKHQSFRCDSNADYWKTQLFNACRTDAGEDGSIEFYFSSNRNEHVTLSKHFTAEEPKEFFEEGKGSYTRWIKHRKGNHLLDTAYNNFVAAHLSGMRLLKNQPSPAAANTAQDATPSLTLPDGRPFSITDR